MRLPSWINFEWRTPKALIALAILELPFTVAALALVGIADPDTYRSRLWLEGSKHGWNSDPIEILYAYANYKPIPVPTPWNQFITNYNVVIVVLSMFIMLLKCVLFITHIFPPFFSAIIHSGLVILYSISIAQQSASDYSDPLHPSKTPWYLTRGCGDPVNPQLQGFCKQAKGTFAVTVVLCVIFGVYLLFSLASCFPNAVMRAARNSKFSDAASPASQYEDKKWEMEMNQWPRTSGKTGGLKSPTVPMTPRTMAFNTLDGTLGARRPNKDLPLRHHISMGSETYKGKGVK